MHASVQHVVRSLGVLFGVPPVGDLHLEQDRHAISSGHAAFFFQISGEAPAVAIGSEVVGSVLDRVAIGVLDRIL